MCIVVHAVGLLVVGSKVLDAGSHIVLPHTRDIGRGSLASHHRVFGIVFKVASTEGVTHDVECRSQQHVGPIFLHLLSDGLANLLDELGVPGGGQQCADGEVGAVVGGRVTLAFGINTQTSRTVGQHDGRYSK